MATSKFQRDAVALVVLTHPEVGMSPSAAARVTGLSKQRFHQRLGDALKRGWVLKKDGVWKMTPRGVQVVESFKRQLADVERSRGRLDLREVMSGQWGAV